MWSASILGGAPVPESKPIRLDVRTRVQPFKGGEWHDVTVPIQIKAAETAVVICDVWDKHWCKSATIRCDAIARRIGPLVETLRARGFTIIHSPSDCMAYYEGSKQRSLMLNAPKAIPPTALDLPDPPLPIDDSDGGCDDQPQCENHIAWKREHPAIRVADSDGVTDKGAEVYNLLRQRGVKNLLIMGVHANMCVLNRTFAIKQMTRWSVRCILVRDLTDTMYNPRMRPKVTHEEGTNLVIRHIEQYWCPSVDSAQLVQR